MSPKEYFSLLFKCFFKYYTLRKEIETWDKVKSIKTIIWANTYTMIIGYTIVCIIVLSITLTFRLHFNFVGLTLSTLLSIVFSLCIGIAIISLVDIFYGIICSIVISFISIFFFATVSMFFREVPFSIYLGVLSAIFIGIAFGMVYRLFIGTFFGIFLGTFWIFLQSLSNSIEQSFYFGLFVLMSFIFTYLFTTGRFWYFFSQPLYRKSNPLWWDENISIPVPFLPKILRGYAKTKDFDKTIEFAKFLIEERPIQRKVAQKGLTLIALDRMKDLKTLKDIQQLKTFLSFMPNAEWFSDFYSENKASFIN